MFLRNHSAEARSELLQTTAARLSEMAAEVDRMALLFDDTGSNCEACGSVHYHNWPQRQFRSRVAGAADRMRELAETVRRRSHDPDFLDPPMTTSKQREAS